MTQDARNFRDLQAQIQQDLSGVQFAPDPSDLAEIEEALPEAWLQSLERAELVTEIDQEIIEPLHKLSDQELDEQIRETIRDLDINVDEIMNELEHVERGHDRAIDFDFGF